MEACIISTAQQARPKVIHISEPVRASDDIVGGGEQEALVGELVGEQAEAGGVGGDEAPDLPS